MKIGADPEYLLIHKKTGRIKSARSLGFFKSSNRGTKIGCDGAGTPVEIRPAPASIRNINRFCINIDMLIKKIAMYINPRDYILVGGSGGNKRVYMGVFEDEDENDYVEEFASIGGHIHFGCPAFIKDLNKKNTNRLVYMLDSYLTPLQNMFLDETENRRRFGGGGYGQLGSVRTQPYGIEYRTPYSFTISPFFTKAWYSLASLIAHNFKKMKRDNDLHYQIQKWYESPRNKNVLKKVYPIIKKEILKTLRYNTPNLDINCSIISLFNLVERKKKYVSLNVIKNYGYEDLVGKKEIFIPKIKYYHDSHLDTICSMISTQDLQINRRVYGETNDNNIYIWGCSDNIVRGHDKFIVFSIRLRELYSIGSIIFKDISTPDMRYEEVRVFICPREYNPSNQYNIGISRSLRKLLATGRYRFNRFKEVLQNVLRRVEDKCAV